MKLKIFIPLFILLSCGVDPNYVYNNNGLKWPKSKLPLTFVVSEETYNRYHSAFQKTEEEYDDAAGFDLVNFVIGEDVNLEYANEAYGVHRTMGNFYIMTKDSDDEFKNYSETALGTAYMTYSGKTMIATNIIMNMTRIGTGHSFRQVLAHEVGHALGFMHTDDRSIMNSVYNDFIFGIHDNDYDRINEKYTYSIASTTLKDLEKMGAKTEGIDRKGLRDFLMNNYGFSADRSEEASKLIYSYEKLGKNRSLTTKERDMFTNSLLGFDYKTGKSALEKHIQGESQEMDELINIASEKNGVDPEAMMEILGNTFLK